MNGNLAYIYVKELMGMPDAHLAKLHWFDLEADGVEGCLVEIANAPLTTKGPRAGLPNWRKAEPSRTRILTRQEYDGWVTEWLGRSDTNCAICANRRDLFVRWHHIEGTTTKPCPCGHPRVAPPTAKLAGAEMFADIK